MPKKKPVEKQIIVGRAAFELTGVNVEDYPAEAETARLLGALWNATATRWWQALSPEEATRIAASLPEQP